MIDCLWEVLSMYTKNTEKGPEDLTLSWMLASSFPPSFLDSYSLSISSLGYKAWYILMIFLVLSSICRSSFLVHFKNGPEYITKRITKVLIPLVRFQLYCFVSRSFLVLLIHSFFYLFINIYLHVLVLPSTCNFTFIRVFLFFLDLVVLFSLSFGDFWFLLLV